MSLIDDAMVKVMRQAIIEDDEFSDDTIRAALQAVEPMIGASLIEDGRSVAIRQTIDQQWSNDSFIAGVIFILARIRELTGAKG
jgi:hypothetical protein